jgi:hypothetical protein
LIQSQISSPAHSLRAHRRFLPDWRLSAVALLLLIVQPLVFFRRVLFNPQRHIPFDIETFHLPLTTYIARCVREGVFPFWDPYPYCGVPIHADIQAQLFYPFTWIAILLGNHSGGDKLFYWMEWLNPLHMILAGVFAFLLLRQLDASPPAALLGGTVYQLGGYFASQAEHLGAICCGAWLPLVLLCALKLTKAVTPRWVAVLAFSVAATILSGFPASAFVVFGAATLMILGLCLWPRPKWMTLGAILAGFALGHAIAAIQIIPTYQLGRLSVASLRADWHLTGGGLRFQSLMSLIIPNYYHIYTPFDPSQYKLPIDFIFLYVYCGLIPLALVLLAPFLRRAHHVRMFFCFTVISAVWMLGDETPLYRLVYTHLPRFVRGALYAEFALMAFCMFMALTSALALQRIARRAPAVLIWCIALLTTLDLTYFGSERAMNSKAGGYRGENSEFWIGDYPRDLAKVHKLVDITNPPIRIDYLDTGQWLFIQGSELLKVPTANGDDPFMLERMLLLRRLFCGGQYWERVLPVNRPGSPLLSMLNVGYLAAQSAGASEKFASSLGELAGSFVGLCFYRTPAPLPRFFLVRRLHISNSAKETFSYLARPDFMPAEEAVVEAQDLQPLEALGDGAIAVELYSPNRIELNVAAAGRAFLATSEALYPGWSVLVNGNPGRFYMTNGAFRGLMLNPGANHITMTYWPEGFLVWTAISIAGLILAVVGLLFDEQSDNLDGLTEPRP